MDIAKARAKVASNSSAGTLELRQRCDRRRSAMLAERAIWKPDWMQVAEYVDPAQARFEQPAGGKQAKRSRAKIINGTATRCVRVASAGLSSHMTSKSRPWFSLTAPDPAIGQLHGVKMWLDDVTEIIRDTLAKSNFYKAMPVAYSSDLLFGVAAIIVAPHDEEVVRFHPLPIGSYAVAMDEHGKVDSLWRTFTMTARNIVARYGEVGEDGRRVPDSETMPDAVCKAFKDAPDQVFSIESLFEPNPEAMPGIGPLGVQAERFRPWREVTWIAGGGSGDKRGVLRVGGHYEAPFICIRFNPHGDDCYSDAPGTDSLGDIKQLQYLEGQKLKLIDLVSEPPVSIPDTMRNLGASLQPRARNFLPMTQHGAKIEPTYIPDHGAIQQVREEIREVERRIENAFFYNLFMMLEALGDQTGRTAMEISARQDEKAAVLGPTLEIVTDEGLDPIVIRTYRLLERAGRIPPPPEELAQSPIKIEYTSILAQAMKAAGVSGIERAAAFMAQMAQIDPAVTDGWDADAALREYGERTGAPASVLRSDDQIGAIRQQRAQRQQLQQMAAMAPAVKDAAQAVKTVGESAPAEGSLGAGLAEMLGGAQ